MDLSERIEAFAKLGYYLKENLCRIEDLPALHGAGELYTDPALAGISRKAEVENPWFIPGFIHHALSETARLLDRENLEKWTAGYPPQKFLPSRPAEVGTILAGNIPLVGFHDFLQGKNVG